MTDDRMQQVLRDMAASEPDRRRTAQPLDVLGGVERGDDWRSATTTLTKFGQATALERIRAESTGPRSRP